MPTREELDEILAGVREWSEQDQAEEDELRRVIEEQEQEIAAKNARILELEDRLDGTTPPPDEEEPPTPTGVGLWMSVDEVLSRPRDTRAFRRLAEIANGTWEPARLEYLNAQGGVQLMAGAMYWVITKNDAMLEKCLKQLLTLYNTKWYRTLEAARELQGYVAAVDLLLQAGVKTIDVPRFCDFIAMAITKILAENSHSGLRTILEMSRRLFSNWANHGRSLTTLVGLFLQRYGSESQKTLGGQWLEQMVKIQRVHNGSAPKSSLGYEIVFDKGGWATSDHGINPRNTTISLYNTVTKRQENIFVGGVQPADRQRADEDPTNWPTTETGYDGEGAQGFVSTMVIMHRAGLLPFNDGDNAVVRMAEWLHGEGEAAKNFPVFAPGFDGDDEWINYFIKKYGGRTFRLGYDQNPGKGLGFGEFLCG